jgi:hypothetical protein
MSPLGVRTVVAVTAISPICTTTGPGDCHCPPATARSFVGGLLTGGTPPAYADAGGYVGAGEAGGAYAGGCGVSWYDGDEVPYDGGCGCAAP